jgi:hypothetical protein
MASRTDSSPGSAPHVIEFETEASGPGAPHIPESPPFLLTYHRHRWRVSHGLLVPALSKFSLESGCNRVEVLAGGKIRMAEARAKLEREGRMVIPQEWGPIETADGRHTYVSHVTTVPSGSGSSRLAHLSAWESWSPGSSDVYRDEEGYAKWLASLVKSGRLPPCSQDDARKLLADAQRKLGVAEAIASGLRSGVVASAAAKAKILKQEVEVLGAYLAKFTENAPRYGGHASQLDIDEDEAPRPAPRREERLVPKPEDARRQEEAVRRDEELAQRQQEEALAVREESIRRREKAEQLRVEDLLRQQEVQKREEALIARELALRQREEALAARETEPPSKEEKPPAPLKEEKPPRQANPPKEEKPPKPPKGSGTSKRVE